MKRVRRSGVAIAALAAVTLALAGCSGPAAAGLIDAGAARTATHRHTAAPTPTPTPSPTPTAEPTPAPLRVVTIGDSIMAAYGLDPSDAWPVLMGQQEHVAVTNLGCSGAGFTVVGNCGQDFSGLIPQAVAAAPQLVIIESSDNDDGASDDTIDEDTTDTMHELRTALPKATIVAFGTLWDQPEDPPETIAEATTAIQSAVQTVGGTFVDIGQPLAGHADLLQSDSEHPTVAGQQVLESDIAAALAHAGITL